MSSFLYYEYIEALFYKFFLIDLSPGAKQRNIPEKVVLVLISDSYVYEIDLCGGCKKMH